MQVFSWHATYPFATAAQSDSVQHPGRAMQPDPQAMALVAHTTPQRVPMAVYEHVLVLPVAVHDLISSGWHTPLPFAGIGQSASRQQRSPVAGMHHSWHRSNPAAQYGGHAARVPSQVCWPTPESAGRHTVPAGLAASTGQETLKPLQYSATSQPPPLSDLQSLVVGESWSGGQLIEAPSHSSGSSQGPAGPRQTVPRGADDLLRQAPVPSHWPLPQGPVQL
jgi:hypothetical protein